MEREPHPHRQEAPRWEPAGFQQQTTTVWSFPERGSWATHDGSYRGNWSPYVPRNLLLRYTAPGDRVLDPFVGGGTSAVEAALLGRRAIAGDLSAAAVSATRVQLDRLQRRRPLAKTPAILREDARALAVADSSMQLVLLHPPYADAIRYSADTAGDLSHLTASPFIDQLRLVATESRRVLAPGGRCALLIGDLRRQGHVVPLGFAAIQACRREGLVLEELIIKRQHHTRMAGRWAGISAERGFLLLAHEYLAMFRRANDPASPLKTEGGIITESGIMDERQEERAPQQADGAVDMGTTVWALPAARMETALPAQVRRAFGRHSDPEAVSFVRTPETLVSDTADATAGVSVWLEQMLGRVKPGGVLAVETRDVRSSGVLHPMGLEVCRALRRMHGARLKEIIAVVPAEDVRPLAQATDPLAITHRYLLVATRDRAV